MYFWMRKFLLDLLSEKFSTQYVYKICISRRTESSYCRAMCMLELLMLKRHILFVPDGDFTAIDEVIRSMCSDWCYDICFFKLFFNFLIFVLFLCTLCTIS